MDIDAKRLAVRVVELEGLNKALSERNAVLMANISNSRINHNTRIMDLIEKVRELHKALTGVIPLAKKHPWCVGCKNCGDKCAGCQIGDSIKSAEDVLTQTAQQDESGPDEEDGPWAEGWAERSREGASIVDGSRE